MSSCRAIRSRSGPRCCACELDDGSRILGLQDMVGDPSRRDAERPAQSFSPTRRRTWRLRPSSSTLMSMAIREVLSTVTQASRAPDSVCRTRLAARRSMSASASDSRARSTATTMMGAPGELAGGRLPWSGSAPGLPPPSRHGHEPVGGHPARERREDLLGCSSKPTAPRCRSDRGIHLQAAQDDLPGATADRRRARAAGSGRDRGRAAGRAGSSDCRRAVPRSPGNRAPRPGRTGRSSGRCECGGPVPGRCRGPCPLAGETPRRGDPGAGRGATGRSR